MTRFLLLTAGALLLGFGSGEYLTRNPSFRRWLADIVRQESLAALVGRHGIYDRDVARAWEAELFARGAAPQDLENSTARAQKRAALDRLITLEKLNAAAADEAIDSAAPGREFDLLRWQVRDEKTWREVLQRAATNPRQLRREAARHLRERRWIENQIAGLIRPNEEECRRYFETHRASFQEPRRWRASHHFLAAPEGYPAEVIETKRALINQLAQRLRNGEAFPALVADFSEDEATKKRGGDLGVFAATRMLPAICEAVQGLRPGQTSAAIRSRLGFHLIRLTETRPPRAQTFEEAMPGIVLLLENQKRARACAHLVAGLR